MYRFVDLHCDTITAIFQEHEHLRKNENHIDLLRMRCYQTPIQIFSIWLEQKCHAVAAKETNTRIDFYYNELHENRDLIRHANSYRELLENAADGVISGLLSLEGGEALEGNLARLYEFYERGVRSITLTWNFPNALAGAAKEGDGARGLTRFGRDVVAEMQELGMLVDVSHLSRSGFWDVCRMAKKPFSASHSNAGMICNSYRNLSDEQLRAIAEKGGVAGINYYPPFLTQKTEASIEDILRHLEYMISVMGEDGVALGGDFDGIEKTPRDLTGMEDLDCLFRQMEYYFGETLTNKITHQNAMRVLSELMI